MKFEKLIIKAIYSRPAIALGELLLAPKKPKNKK